GRPSPLGFRAFEMRRGSLGVCEGCRDACREWRSDGGGAALRSKVCRTSPRSRRAKRRARLKGEAFGCACQVTSGEITIPQRVGCCRRGCCDIRERFATTFPRPWARDRLLLRIRSREGNRNP